MLWFIFIIRLIEGRSVSFLAIPNKAGYLLTLLLLTQSTLHSSPCFVTEQTANICGKKRNTCLLIAQILKRRMANNCMKSPQERWGQNVMDVVVPDAGECHHSDWCPVFQKESRRQVNLEETSLVAFTCN